jgi:hypothetical protein
MSDERAELRGKQTLIDAISREVAAREQRIEVLMAELAEARADIGQYRRALAALNGNTPKPKPKPPLRVKTGLRVRERRLVDYIELHEIERMSGPEVKEWTGLRDPDAYAALTALRDLGYLAKAGVEVVYGRKRQTYRVLDIHAIDHLREVSP